MSVMREVLGPTALILAGPENLSDFLARPPDCHWFFVDGELCSFGVELRNLKNKSYLNKKLSSEEPEVPRTLKLERWQGTPHIYTVKQYEIVLSFWSVCLFSLFNNKKKEFDYLVCFVRKISVSEDLKISSLKIYS